MTIPDWFVAFATTALSLLGTLSVAALWWGVWVTVELRSMRDDLDKLLGRPPRRNRTEPNRGGHLPAARGSS